MLKQLPVQHLHPKKNINFGYLENYRSHMTVVCHRRAMSKIPMRGAAGLMLIRTQLFYAPAKLLVAGAGLCYRDGLYGRLGGRSRPSKGYLLG